MKPLFTNRNPWPIAIVAVFVLFIGATIGLIIFSTYHRVELVTPDYYEQEVRYQEQIDRRTRTASLSAQPEVVFDAQLGQIRISVPYSSAGHLDGNVHLYRPSGAGQDQRVPLALDSRGQQRLDTRALQPGLWRVRVSWRVGDLEYAHDANVIVARQTTI